MIKPDKSKQESKKIQIKDMFNDISSRYDQINKMMTLNMDKNWRRIVYNLSMEDNPNNIIDIATGTGDIACLLYTSPSPRDRLLSRMPSSA